MKGKVCFNLWTGPDGQAMADIPKFGYLLDRHVDPTAPLGERAKPLSVDILVAELAEKGYTLGEGYLPEIGASGRFSWKHPVKDEGGRGIGCLRLESDQVPSSLGLPMMARR